MSDSLQPHVLKHVRLPCPSLSPGVCSDSSPDLVMPSTISSSVIPSLSLTSIFPSIMVFSSESALHIRWPNYWRISFSTSNEYSELISFKIDWFDLLAVQETLRSLLQHHNSKALTPQCSLFFMVRLSHLYMNPGKNHTFDSTDLCWQFLIYCFLIYCPGLSLLFFHGASVF